MTLDVNLLMSTVFNSKIIIRIITPKLNTSDFYVYLSECLTN